MLKPMMVRTIIIVTVAAVPLSLKKAKNKPLRASMMPYFTTPPTTR
jgi:hypothetical protein